MALLNNVNNYIKLIGCGRYYIYNTSKLRDKIINSPSKELILYKYQYLIDILQNKMFNLLNDYCKNNNISLNELQVELVHTISIDETRNKLIELSRERSLYEQDVHIQKGARHNYPIMAQYYPNVRDSVPEITESGIIPALERVRNVRKNYEIAKEMKIFGETKDI